MLDTRKRLKHTTTAAILAAGFATLLLSSAASAQRYVFERANFPTGDVPTELRTRLRVRADTLEVTERQKILRLLVREILVGLETITIRHSIPVPTSEGNSTGGCRPSHEPPNSKTGPHYLLRSDRLNACDDCAEGWRGSRRVRGLAIVLKPSKGWFSLGSHVLRDRLD